MIRSHYDSQEGDERRGGGVGAVKNEGPAFPSVSSVLRDVGNGGLIFMKFMFEWRRKRVVMEGRD